jgi:ubiquinone/menaquinone biosynthesis C-methylase UbiE
MGEPPGAAAIADIRHNVEGQPRINRMSEDPRSTSLDEAWSIGDQLAKGWEANADFVARTSAPVQRWIVEHLEPGPGQTILELGAGPGDTGFEVARTLGDDGKLISTDISPAMVEVARRRVVSQSVSNADFRVMDAQRIDLEDSSVDGVIHRFGPMLLPDPDASFREVRRVLRDEGAYAAAVFSGPQHNAWMMTLAMAVMQNGIEMPGGSPVAPGGPFSLADPEALRQRVSDANFSDVVVEGVLQPFEFEDLEQAFRVLSETAGPLALIIAGLEPEKRESVKATFKEAGGQYRNGGSYMFPGQALCLIAR